MESCRAPTLLADLDDDDPLPDDDENDDENEDDEDYEEVMVSRNLLSFMVNIKLNKSSEGAKLMRSSSELLWMEKLFWWSENLLYCRKISLRFGYYFDIQF